MDHKKRMHGFGFAAVFIALYFLSMPSAFSDDGIKIRPVVKDETLISPELLQKLLPGADRVAAQEGKPPARAVYKDGKLYGYIVSTHVVMDSTGFAGNPFDILVGLGMDAQIKGAHLADHNEPILIIGVAEKKIYEYVDQFRGVDIRNRVMPGIAPENGTPRIDGVSGASISSVIMSDAILRSSRLVARSRKILVSSVGRGTLDIDSFRKSDWAQLLADGDVKRLRIQNKDLSKFFRKQGVTVSLAGDEDATFIDLYVTLATPATIGRNLLGENSYQRLMAQKESQGQLIFIAAQGLYSFKGTTWKKTGLFDRIQIIQGERTIRLLKNQYLRVDKINAPGAPNLREAALFTLPANSGLVATDPWQLDLLVERESSSGEKVFAGFQAQYELPSRYIQTQSSDPKLSDDYAFMKDSSGEDAYWVSIWRERLVRIGVLVFALGVLTLILFLEDVVARRKRLYAITRLGFLIFTLVWLGWYAGAQLSVLNVLTFSHSLLTGFKWEFFLLEPLLFILWGYVAVAMLFWGRGVYCGWLCPFGALQELLNKIARKFGLIQFQLPFGLHQRLWVIKYIIFLGLFALSLHSMVLVSTLIEVEPFKTAVIFRFVREFPFIIYVAVLLVAGLFIERFFCRYLCPLGAALAIPARLKMFEWLKRRRQCGTECNICAVNCTVQSIHPNGSINPNECIYCLKCQVFHFDERKCPPLISRRERREARERANMEAGTEKEAAV